MRIQDFVKKKIRELERFQTRMEEKMRSAPEDFIPEPDEDTWIMLYLLDDHEVEQ